MRSRVVSALVIWGGAALAVPLVLCVCECGAARAAEPVPSTKGTVQQRLQQETTLSFRRDTLERAIDNLSEKVGVPMVILVDDLRREGITKNQSFGLDESGTAEQILRAILLKADPDGRLVYVVRETGDTPSIAITTRAAATERKEEVPATMR